MAKAHLELGRDAKSDEHVTVMSGLAKVLVNPEQAERLRTAADADAVLELLAPEETS